MKKIPLSRGLEAIIDDDDYELLSKYSWSVGGGTRRYPYAITTIQKNKSLKMHRLIMRAKKNQLIDHINHDTLDNRKENLRICTQSQNQANRKKHKKTSSKFKGVNFYKRVNAWRARIQINKKDINIGWFLLEREAAIAYNEVAKKHFGEFALLNDV